METPKIATTWTSGHPRLKQSLKRPPLCGLGSDERPEGLSGRVLPPNAPVMHQSIEEDEVTAQRDAAVSLFKGLQERIRTQAAEYEARTEAAEMGRIKYEILLEKLQLEESGSAMTARAQVRTVTQGWAMGTVLGWSAGLLLGCLFSPVLGFMLVLPFVAAGVVGGLTYAQLRDKMRSLRREKGRQLHSPPSMDKEEFLRQLQGRSDPSATGGQFGADGNALPSGSL